MHTVIIVEDEVGIAALCWCFHFSRLPDIGIV